MKITIRKMLKERKLSIRSAAKKCGLPYSTLIDICADKVMPRLDTLEIIAKGLSCKLEDLYEADMLSNPAIQEDVACTNTEKAENDYC